MNSRITISKIAAIVIIFITTTGQGIMAQINDSRMNQDLEIAENILATLTSRSSDRSREFMFGRNSSSSYVEGYGVIFNIPSNDGIYIMNRSASDRAVIVYEQSRSNAYGYSNDPATVEFRGKEEARVRNGRTVNLDSLQDVNTKQTIEVMQTFIADYADLIGQLKPTDHIMITTRKSIATNNFEFFSPRKSDIGVTAEVVKSDLASYKSGAITRDQLLKKIAITKEESNTEKVADLELLVSIFERLYKSDLSNTYYVSGSGVRYEKLKNFGAIVSMKVYSSQINDGLYTIQTQGLSQLSKQDRDKKVEALYPEFEKTLKENIVNYGRTVKSIQPNEILMFKVNLTECKDCAMPKSIDLNIEASILADFDKGKIDMKTAVSKIKIKKY